MKKIVVIEDEPDVRSNIVEMLEEEGYAVSAAVNGLAGVDLIRAAQPDLVICDILMPGLDGYGVLEAVAGDAALVGIPFLFLTALFGRGDMRKGMNLGADDYITKPFSRTELLDAIHVRLGKQERIEAFSEKRMNALEQSLRSSLPRAMITPISEILENSRLLEEQAENLAPVHLRQMGEALERSAHGLLRLFQVYAMNAELDLWMARQDLQERLRELPGVAPEEWVEAMIADKAGAVGRLADFTVEVEDASLAMGEEHAMKLLEELLDNALSFSLPGSPIAVTGRVVAPGRYELVVEDHGVGMTAEQIRIAHSFVQFNRDTFDQGNVGLGLALAKKIVAAYNGTLAITSQPEMGCKVTLLLPLNQRV